MKIVGREKGLGRVCDDSCLTAAPCTVERGGTRSHALHWAEMFEAAARSLSTGVARMGAHGNRAVSSSFFVRSSSVGWKKGTAAL